MLLARFPRRPSLLRPVLNRIRQLPDIEEGLSLNLARATDITLPSDEIEMMRGGETLLPSEGPYLHEIPRIESVRFFLFFSFFNLAQEADLLNPEVGPEFIGGEELPSEEMPAPGFEPSLYARVKNT